MAGTRDCASTNQGGGTKDSETLNNESFGTAVDDYSTKFRDTLAESTEFSQPRARETETHRCNLNVFSTVENVADVETRPESTSQLEAAPVGAPSSSFALDEIGTSFPNTVHINNMDLSKLQKPNEPEIGRKIVVPVNIEIQSKFKNPKLHALVDSGAPSYFVSHESLQRLGISHMTTVSTPIKLSSAFSNAQRCKHRIRLTISLGSIKTTQNFFVVHGLSHDMILGTPFIERYCQDINWEDYSVSGVPTTISTPIVISSIEFDRLAKSRENEIFLCVIKFDENKTDSDEDLLKSLPFDASEYTDVLTSKPPNKLPPLRSITHEINLVPGSDPPSRPPYRQPEIYHEHVKQELEKLLEAGFIQPSSSPYSAPVLLVKKKDGSFRMCVDYRQLNDITIKNRYPLPIIEDLIYNVKGAIYFSKLDLRSGYHQIRIRPEDVPKTAFSTKNGHWEFLVMPFGLTNAPATFQNFMNDIFRPYIDKFVNVYLDDILVFSETKEQHIEHLKKVLNVLKENQLVANVKKCEFFKTSLDFLGFHIDQDGIHITDEKIKAVKEFPQPKTVKDCQRFLGMANYYRKFVRLF